MRERITTLYGALAMLWALAVVVQVFLAGLGIFGASSFDAHESFGFTLHAILVLLVILAIAGPRTGRDIGMAVGLLVLVSIQIALVGSRDSAPGLAALHPVLALAAMGLAVHMGMHVLRGGRRVPGPASRALTGADATGRGRRAGPVASAADSAPPTPSTAI